LLAIGTLIQVDAESVTPIQEIEVGNEVWVGGLDLDWKRATIMMSMGTGPGQPIRQIHIQTADQGELIGAMDLLVLTTEGLVRMSVLMPGQTLVRADGGRAQIVYAMIGESSLGEHALSTSDRATTDPEGHLLVANGFIVGDYALSTGLPRDPLASSSVPAGETA